MQSNFLLKLKKENIFCCLGQKPSFETAPAVLFHCASKVKYAAGN